MTHPSEQLREIEEWHYCCIIFQGVHSSGSLTMKTGSGLFYVLIILQTQEKANTESFI